MKYKASLLTAAALLSPTLTHADEITVQVWASTWQSLVEPASKRFEEAHGHQGQRGYTVELG